MKRKLQDIIQEKFTYEDTHLLLPDMDLNFTAIESEPLRERFLFTAVMNIRSAELSVASTHVSPVWIPNLTGQISRSGSGMPTVSRRKE